MDTISYKEILAFVIERKLLVLQRILMSHVVVHCCILCFDGFSKFDICKF